MRKIIKKYMEKILLILYCVVLAYILFFRTKFYVETDYWQTISFNKNLVPFKTIRYYMARNDEWYALKNLIGNIAIFTPCGYFLARKGIGFCKSMLFSAVLVAGIELAQLFSLRGTCDIDDWILNMAGVGIGYFLCCVLKRIFARNDTENVVSRKKD